MKNWVMHYCEAVEAWLDERTVEQIKSLAKEIKLLENCGNTLRLPHSRSLGKGLFELRERAYGYRIYYAFLPGYTIVLLQAGDKKTQTRDIGIARDLLTKVQKSGDVK
jgi:putative addiction module killer protein